MGNSQATIPEDFSKTCHSGLRHAIPNKKTGTLEIRVQAGSSFGAWRDRLESLRPYNKHLLMPEYFWDDYYDLDGCCAREGSENSGDYIMKAGFPPFIYTLENEIMMRKMSNRQFREHDVWKLLKAGALALRDWKKVYPQAQLGPLTPKAILFDLDGQIKVAHKFSFPAEYAKSVPTPYYPPETRPNHVIKYSPSKPGPVTGPTIDIYSLGLTLIEAISQEQCQSSSVTTSQKRQFVDQSLIHTLDLKVILLHMTEEEWSKRAQLEDVLMALHKYKMVEQQEGEKYGKDRRQEGDINDK